MEQRITAGNWTGRGNLLAFLLQEIEWNSESPPETGFSAFVYASSWSLPCFSLSHTGLRP